MTKRTDKNLSNAIGRAIAQKRQRTGLTQAQVAEHIGVSDDAISRMERGNIMPTIKRLAELADLFDCETADFLTCASPTINDETRHVMNLLMQLAPHERRELIAIIERLVDWKSQ
ncbi:hypothetical protein B0181_04460 [Moraxella caviae]|uniref:DNA-binding transcriptional repressor PuuR n=1 Tax=Moraxella caviae TaxID=34060 RepID=A0A1T0A5H9_9GAMM|nr:helix-turn-helix transcriptional regulator [Moraxella caviae]OOR90848.1 hypothetical protein B0181_04460 [Moraxella caviae]STZ10683.1 DNA-binding transcriptional repressor PuuR [Moraxella caviae]